MIALDIGSEPGLHLLEPYQWALICHAMSEGLAHHEGDVESRDTHLATPEETATTLQLLVLNERVSLTHIGHVDPETAKKQKKAPVNLDALANTGLVTLVAAPDFHLIEQRNSYREQWEAIRPDLERYESFILAQFRSRHFNNCSHWAIYRYMIAVRTGNNVMASLVEPSILPEHREVAEVIARRPQSPDLRTLAAQDQKFFNAARRVRHAFSLAFQGSARVVGAAPVLDVPRVVGTGVASAKVWRIVVSALIEEDIQFPVPASFADVTRLRALPEVRAFREFVGPFVDKFVAGDERAYKELRKEIKSAVRALKLFPYARKLLDWTTYAGVPISTVEAMTGAIGPSIVTGVTAVGLKKLASRWREQARWLYLSSDCQNRL